MSTTTRADQFASQFAAVNAETIAVVTDCGEAQWRQPSASDGRPVGVLAHHIADVNGAFAAIIEKLAAGDTYSPAVSMEEVHRRNAEHTRAHAAVGKQETLDLLHANGAAILRAIDGIDDGLFDRTAGIFGGHEMTVAQVMEWVVIGHTADHLATIRATLAERLG